MMVTAGTRSYYGLRIPCIIRLSPQILSMFLSSLMGTAERHVRAELDLSILETVSRREGNVNQGTDHILLEISSTFSIIHTTC